MGTKELTNKIWKLKELKSEMDDLAAEISSIEDDIKAEMLARGVDELTVDVYRVRWSHVTSRRFDTKAFKATHKELFEQYSKEVTSRRFTVS